MLVISALASGGRVCNYNLIKLYNATKNAEMKTSVSWVGDVLPTQVPTLKRSL